jgi:hypothetical protein
MHGGEELDQPTSLALGERLRRPFVVDRSSTGRMLAAALAVACASKAGAAPRAPEGPRDAPPAANLLGMNIGAPLDWEGTRPYADVMRTARSFQKPSGAPADVDAEGWPREDFKVVVWHGIDRMHGTYALSFTGMARVRGGYGDHEISGVRYDAATNTTTARIHYRATDGSGLELQFTGTQRTPRDRVGSGVIDIRLMRPVTPGSTTSYPTTALWHKPIETLLRKFQVVRYMDYLATNGSQQRNWSDRPLPSWASFNRMSNQNGYGWQGIGGPLEHVVLLSNELERDAWIDVPAKATDDYVRKVAQLFRFGSDGVNPYTSPQANPVYPPLDARLKLYVEYSNEVWNGAGPFQVQFKYNHDQAQAEVAGGRSPLSFDGETGEWTLAWRRVAKRGVEISQIFREVFGDAQMMTRVRPVLMTQQGDGQGTLSQAVRLLQGYYNNGEGNFVATPRPPSAYFYGAGGSGYYNPDNASPTLTLSTIWDSMTMSVDRWREVLRRDADRAAAMGVRRVCYEGGPSLDSTGNGDAVKALAVRDPRMSDALVAHHEAWTAFGGDLFVFLTAVGDHQWGFTPDVQDLRTPKLQAIDLLRAAPRGVVTYGNPVPGVVEGNRFAFSSRGWDAPGPGRRPYARGPKNFEWASYTFRGSDASRRTVALRVASASHARVAVYWDGALLGERVVPLRGPSLLALGTVDVAPGLHGLIVRAVEGEFVVDAVSLE